MDTRENSRFIRILSDAGAITAQTRVQLDMEAIKNEFGSNFNTLLMTNNSTEELIVELDRRQVRHLPGGGARLGLDWEDGIQFTEIWLFNNDAAAATSANEIRISVGRTGANNG